MKKGVFYQFGKVIHPLRWVIVLLFVVVVGVCVPFLPKVMSRFTDTGLSDPHSQSALTEKFLDQHLDYYNNRFIIMYQGEKKFDKQFSDEIKTSLAGLKNLSYKHEILYPSDNDRQISADKLSAYAIVLLKDNRALKANEIEEIKSEIKPPPHLKMLVGGEPVFNVELQKQTETDLIKAEYIATPVAVITLLIVFGSVAAAFVPMILDGACAILILTILYFVGHRFELSVFTINIALLLGLCLSLDYALFIISRFREELAEGRNIVEALAITQATAGKAVFFSGLAVLISLTALFLFPINILLSVGVGGVTAVAVAVLVSVVLLPAILAIMQDGINFLPIKILSRSNGKHRGYWFWLVSKVVKFPWTFFIIIVAVLLLLSYPVLSVKFGLSDYRILPKTLESRQVFDLFKTEFNENDLTPITVVVKTSQGKMLTQKNIGYLYDFVEQIKKDDRVDDVDSIVSTEPLLTKQQYQQFYTLGKDNLNTGLKKLLKLTTEDDFTVITVVSKYISDSTQTKHLIKKIRNVHVDNLKVDVTGQSASTIDVLKTVSKLFPYALIWIIVLTYLVLLILLRSLLLPVKAIIMNMLSLAASYGVLVFIIQEGYFSTLLHFNAQGIIDISLLIIIFCALFGFSMDYEVFLLTRIKECYEQTGDTNKSVCYGIAQSSKIITSAALVVIFICFAFLSADILMVKAFGLGVAVAIFVDAFLIRTLLVPAIMAILQRWNWYLPKWLDSLLPQLSFNPEEKHF